MYIYYIYIYIYIYSVIYSVSMLQSESITEMIIHRIMLFVTSF